MLNSLPKTSQDIFPASYAAIFICYNKLRKRVASMQHNPRILSIEFRSFRHWGGTMIAYRTNGNVLTVKKLLRHKRIENTMKYIGMIHFKDEDYEVAAATTVDEIKQMAQAGFQKFDEINGVHIFRKPKIFSIKGLA